MCYKLTFRYHAPNTNSGKPVQHFFTMHLYVTAFIVSVAVISLSLGPNLQFCVLIILQRPKNKHVLFHMGIAESLP